MRFSPLLAAIVMSSPAFIQAQAVISGPVAIPQSAAVAAALSAAGGYRVIHDALWKDYEDVVEIATLNEIAKIALNSNQSLVTADYNNAASQIQSALSTAHPQNLAVLSDQAAALRYAINKLSTQISNPSGPIASAIAAVEAKKFTLLETALNTSRQAPADLALYSLATPAHQFILDQIQDACDLGQNDPRYAAAVNLILKDLLGFDTTNTYLNIQNAYPNVIPSLTVNPDGSLSVTTQGLMAQYGAAVNGMQSATDQLLSSLKALGGAALRPRATNGCSFSIAPTSSSQSGGGGGGSVGVTAPSGCTWVAAPDPGDGDTWITVTSGATGSGNGTVIFTVSPNSGSSGRSGVITIAGLPFVVTQNLVGDVTSGPCSDASQKPPCWNDLQSALDDYTKVLGFVGQLTGDQSLVQFASQAGKVADAGIQIGQAIQSIAAGAAVAGPVGAIVGAAETIFSVFSSSSSGQANPAVLRQISNISAQIASLEQIMNMQFALVDSQLNAIMTTLNQQFTYIDYKLGVLTTGVASIETSLYNVESQLNQMEQYTLQYAQASSKSGLILKMNGCLNYAKNNPGAPDIDGMYGSCANYFYTWANNDSSNAIWALQPANYTDPNIYNFFELSPNTEACPTGCAVPFAVDVNYLAQFPVQNAYMRSLGTQALSTSLALANPNEWTLGARSYLELAHEWPQYANGKASSLLSDLIGVGQTFQRAVQNANSTANGAWVFTGATGEYFNATASLQSALNDERDTFVSGLLGGVPPQGFKGFYLWGGSAQSQSPPYTYLPAALQQPIPGTPTNNKTALLLPPGLSQLVPNSIKLVDQLGIGNSKLTLIYAVGNPVGMSVNGVPFPQVTCSRGVARFVEIQGNFVPNQAGFDRVGSFCALDGSNSLGGSDDPSSCFNNQVNCYSATIMDWQNDVNGVRSGWAANSVEMDPGAATYWGQYLDNNIFPAAQKGLYAQIASDLGRATALQVAAQWLTGAKLLLQAYANLGLPVSIASNSTLRSVLYGSSPIFDLSALQADFMSFSNSATNTTDNKITDEIDSINLRLSMWSIAISASFSRVQTTGVPESMSQIDETLADLQAFEAVQNSGALLTQCAYQLSGSGAAVSSQGGSLSFVVQALPHCPWRVSTGVTWLTASGPRMGNGQGSISISAVANATGSPRTGVVIVGDQIFRVFQNSF